MEILLIALSLSIVISCSGLVVVSLQILKMMQSVLESPDIQVLVDKMKASSDALKAVVDANQPKSTV